jgi:hypothetical protein
MPGAREPSVGCWVLRPSVGRLFWGVDAGRRGLQLLPKLTSCIWTWIRTYSPRSFCPASPFLSWTYWRPVAFQAGRLFHLKAAVLTGENRDKPTNWGNGPWPPHLPAAEQQVQAGETCLGMNVDRREINRLHLAAEGLMSAVFELSPLRYSAHASERFYSPSERPVTFSAMHPASTVLHRR